jgi:glycosyltransferase involved in cell wall biosynthesis
MTICAATETALRGSAGTMHKSTSPTMRLLHIIGTISPEAGGPTESVRSLLNFGPPDYRGEVVTLDPPDAPFLKELNFTVHPLGPGKGVYAYSAKLRPWLLANAHRFDGVVVNGLWQYVGFAAWRTFAGKKPYVVFTHGMLDPYFKNQFPLKHLKKWLYWVSAEYWILRGAYRVLFTTDAEERLARQSFWLHRWKGFVVPYGASSSMADPADELEAFYTHCPELRGRRFLLFLGRIHRKKGCDLLVDAFAKIAELDPTLELVMAGPDQQRWSAELKARAESLGIADRVHWPGMLKGLVKWGAFRASEAFVLPSHQENFGIAVAEAMSCHRPVLLADKVNIAEEIADDGGGLMETDTLDGTIRLLERWIRLTAEEKRLMGERAFQTFARRYDMRHNATRIIRLFDEAPGMQHRAGSKP